MELKSEDTLRILRAVMKISSSFNNLDELHGSLYNKYEFKRMARGWSALMELHLKRTTDALTEENEDLFTDIYMNFDKCSEGIVVVNEERTNLVLFYGKIVSAVHDIEKMEYENHPFTYHILSSTKRLISQMERQFAKILERKDDEGHNVNTLISNFDDFGEAIMIIKQEDVGRVDS
jgi:hypothetical protein